MDDKKLRKIDALVAEHVMGWRWRSFEDGGWKKDIYPPNAIELTWRMNPDAPPLESLPCENSLYYASLMPRYTTDGAAMLDVLNKLIELGWHPGLWYEPDDTPWCLELMANNNNEFYGPYPCECDQTAPLAVCLTALKAVGVEI